MSDRTIAYRVYQRMGIHAAAWPDHFRQDCRAGNPTLRREVRDIYSQILGSY